MERTVTIGAMHTVWAIVVLAAVGLWAPSSLAGPFEDALVAAEAGEFETALGLLAPLAEAGDSASQYNLGVLYENGRGVEQNNEEAARLYGLAARQGHANAQRSLGAMYGNGWGVDRDLSEAYVWFSLSAAQGNDESIEFRDIAAFRLSAEALLEARRRSGTYWELYVVPFRN
jgi:TPR repeat protein